MTTRRPQTRACGSPRLYRRKLSREDVDTQTVLITKDRWGHFPPPLQEFTVRVGRETFVTTIVAEDCSCVLPAHQHYHLEAGHFVGRLRFLPGSTIEIEPREDGLRIRNG